MKRIVELSIVAAFFACLMVLSGCPKNQYIGRGLDAYEVMPIRSIEYLNSNASSFDRKKIQVKGKVVSTEDGGNRQPSLFVLADVGNDSSNPPLLHILTSNPLPTKDSMVETVGVFYYVPDTGNFFMAEPGVAAYIDAMLEMMPYGPARPE